MSLHQTNLVDFGNRSKLKVYPIGIGAMRLPQEEEQAVPLIRQAIDMGMIYIDTSRGYGDSEIKVGKSLKGGYRQKVILSTKWSPWVKKIEPGDDTSADCTYKRIIESMERLDVDYLDFYQIWNINSSEHCRQAVTRGGMLDGIRRAMDEGLVKHTGFTTHDTPENISQYIDGFDWCETILFTYNILNQKYADAMAKAHEKGIATVVMNPLGGGMLAEDSPVIKSAVLKAAGTDDVVQIAYRYLAGNKNIDTILCGINKPFDIVSTLENYNKPPLAEQEIETIEKALRKLSSENMGFCTSCKYCMPCPQGINIPAMMNVSYLDNMLKVPRKAKDVYGWHISENNPYKSASLSSCVECGQCEEKCTQNLNIMQELKNLFEKYE
jgi:predicted aldo/keto reductase-like oxidoreductase